jgi:hypothetical protein
VKLGTKVRILAALLLLAAAALSGTSAPGLTKNATGCWRSETGGSPGLSGCQGGGDGCYVCLHSDRYGIYHCFESPDGEIIYCAPGSE